MRINKNVVQLFPPQEEVIKSGLLDKKSHCFICMPTGSGKTFLAEYAINKTLEAGFKAIYITPLRALATEQGKHFRDKFQNTKIGVFTGDTIQKLDSKTSYSSSQLLIMTPERLDACMRNWRSHWTWIPDVDLIIFDEFHILNQSGRGPRLEGTITRFIRLNPFVRIIGLSATMPNAMELSDWLHGTSFSSQWRRVPLENKIVRFKNAKEKPELLLREVERCVAGGGQSLVFCNSRSRVQTIARFLYENGIPSDCHHAGLLGEKREDIESRFKSGEIKVLVATSTLEMGVNLPARQVVMFDSYSYSETGFQPLPVWSFIQRSGRAGRPGLDEKGEAILMLPRWSGQADKYLNSDCEKVNSLLTATKSMQEQILIDIFAGYSRSRDELSNGFLPLTFYKKQHPEAAINGVINKLLLSDLLIERKDDDDRRFLSCGLLGRLAVKLMFSPETVKMIKDSYEKLRHIYLFDILLTATLTEDCSPNLQVNYEELDYLCKTVRGLNSSLLDLSLESIRKKFPLIPDTARILSGIKMASVCYALTTGVGLEQVAQEYNVFESDVQLLQENVIRILMGITAIITAIDKSKYGEDEVKKRKQSVSYPANLSQILTTMLKYEIDSKLVSLTQINGVGGKTAKKLAEYGYSTLQGVAVAIPTDISRIPSIGVKMANHIVSQAQEIIKNKDEVIYEEKPYKFLGENKELKTTIDPYRLRRSLELSVKGRDGFKFLVIGGREDHLVVSKGDNFICDCKDYENNGGNCKHILCVKRTLGDAEICKMAKRIKENKSQILRESLSSLWFSVTGKGDTSEQ